MKKPIILLILFNISINLIAQNTSIKLIDPSFEVFHTEYDQYTAYLESWADCNIKSESPIDIQPGIFNVLLEPYDGLNYVGMVTRENGTYEGISQKLETKLMKLQAYTINVKLAKSVNYADSYPIMENTKLTTGTTRLVITAGKHFCDDQQILAISPPIDHSEWINYYFLLIPSEKYSYITFTVFYVGSKHNAYDGNILIDKLSTIKAVEKIDVEENMDLFSNVIEVESKFPPAYFKD